MELILKIAAQNAIIGAMTDKPSRQFSLAQRASALYYQHLISLTDTWGFCPESWKDDGA
jgi:hypothetical protein